MRKLEAALIVGAILASGTLCYAKYVSGTQLTTKVVTRLPAGCKGWTICWAQSLTCVGNDIVGRPGMNRYVIVSASGRKVIRDIKCDGVPLSVHSNSPVVYSRFSCTGGSQFLGALNLNTWAHKRILDVGVGYWETLPIFYWKGRFWSANHSRVLAYSFSERRVGDTLIIADIHNGKMVKWRAEEGKISSWFWPDHGPESPLVLTVSPGRLYRIGAQGSDRVRVPAIDNAYAAMLSPRLDRAIGFRSLASGAYYVDLDRPEVATPIRATDACNLVDMRVEWALWSPTGERLALVLSQPGGSRKLYVGNPAQCMQPVALRGFKLPGQDDSDSQLSGLTVAWNKDGTSLFCLLTDKKNAGKKAPEFAVGRIDL
ncbi:MAG: hypothetical protein ACYC0V_08125 [Armatimonadota bacterium]